MGNANGKEDDAVSGVEADATSSSTARSNGGDPSVHSRQRRPPSTDSMSSSPPGSPARSPSPFLFPPQVYIVCVDRWIWCLVWDDPLETLLNYRWRWNRVFSLNKRKLTWLFRMFHSLRGLWVNELISYSGVALDLFLYAGSWEIRDSVVDNLLCYHCEEGQAWDTSYLAFVLSDKKELDFLLFLIFCFSRSH